LVAEACSEDRATSGRFVSDESGELAARDEDALIDAAQRGRSEDDAHLEPEIDPQGTTRVREDEASDPAGVVEAEIERVLRGQHVSGAALRLRLRARVSEPRAD